MKKIILTEADRYKIISEKEKAIIESFAKTFNKIKRIDENMLDENKPLSPEEQKILNDILSNTNSLNEGMFDSVLEKVKSYVKKGMMTAGILAALLSTPGMSIAQQNALKNVAKTEMSVQNNGTDISKMSNTEVYNLFVKVVKTNPDRAMALLSQMHGSSKEDMNDINMLQTFVKSIKDNNPIKDANYMGHRLKVAGKFTQQIINEMQNGPYVGGFGGR
jgi:hypothetical protein